MGELRPESLRAARALLGWDNKTLAERAGVSENTVQSLQTRQQIARTVRTARPICAALEKAGIEFVEIPNAGGFGVVWRPPRK